MQNASGIKLAACICYCKYIICIVRTYLQEAWLSGLIRQMVKIDHDFIPLGKLFTVYIGSKEVGNLPSWQTGLNISAGYGYCLSVVSEITKQFKGHTRNCQCLSLIPVPFLHGGKIHSSIYLFGDKEQLECLAFCHPSALDSVLNWPCPAHHHRTTAYQDTEMTCNMSPDSRKGGDHHLFFHSPATSFVSLLFNFPVPCFLSAYDA